jgi:hypothetical protein
MIPRSAIVAFAVIVFTFIGRLAIHFVERRSSAARISNATGGDLYSVVYEKEFRVAKVLVVDSDAVHIRLYKSTFYSRPSEIIENQLVLGKYDDPDGFGIGHLPLASSEFAAWQPVFIKKVAVSPDELDGYEYWKESGGGVWNSTAK